MISVILLLCSNLYATEINFSLQNILDMAENGPETKSANSNALEAKSKSDAVFRKVYLPKVSAGFGYQYMLNDQAIHIPQVINLPLDDTSKTGNIGVTQVLFDPSNMLYKHPASKYLSEASSLNAKRQIKETQMKAIELTLHSLELRAKRKALEKYVYNLKGRLNEIQRIYELGGLGEGDVLKVKLGIDDAIQGIREYQKGENYLSSIIATILGEDSPIALADLPEELPTETNSINRHMEIDINKREDVQAIDKQLAALNLSRKGNKLEYLPKVYGYYQHNYNDNALLKKSNFDVVGIQVSWSIFDGGVDYAEANANFHQEKALESKRSLAVSAYKADVEDALSGLRIKRQEFEERTKNVLQARSVTDSEFKRLKSGKSTVNNLIDAEDILKDRTEKASLSRIDWYQAWFKYKHASGEKIVSP